MRRVFIEVDHPGARINEFGGLITPKTASLLRFVTKGGDVVFTKMVHIPARPYFRPAFHERQRLAEQTILRMAKAYIERLIK